MNEVTRILSAIEKGDVHAVDELFPIIYQELRYLAAQQLSRELPGQTLQATALVNEACLRLVGGENQHWSGRHHFFAAEAEVMRRILIESARRKKSLKHGGSHRRVNFDEAVLAKDDDSADDELIVLDEALEKLSKTEKAEAVLVKFRYFAGLTLKQAAEVMDISYATAIRLMPAAGCV